MMLQGQNGLLFHVDNAVVGAVSVDDATLTKAIIAASGHGNLDTNDGMVIAHKHLYKNNLG